MQPGIFPSIKGHAVLCDRHGKPCQVHNAILIKPRLAISYARF